MARNKYPELTVNKILDVSTQLFAEKGYDNVTIQDIVDNLGGMTKGAIYHHFKGKEEIFNAIVNRMVGPDNIFEQARRAPGLTGLQRIQKVVTFSMTNSTHVEGSEIAMPILDTPQFLRKQLHDCVEEHAPYIREFIDQGNADGSLDVKYPRQAAECFMLMISIWLNPAIFSYDEIAQKVRHLQLQCESIGMPVLDDKITEQLIDYYLKITT